MSYKTDKKLLNLYIFLDLFKMQKHLPFNQKKLKRTQDKRVKKLAKKAYDIPFYKERFDKANITYKDIKEAKDLAKLPILTKEELREWMKNEDKSGNYEYWYHDKTSGSTGNPTMILFSPKEKAYNMANWFRVMLLSGYNPFFGKTMSPVATHSESGTQKTFLQKLKILRREFLDNSLSEQEIIDRINSYKPDFLYTNKSTLMKIALYAKNNNIDVYKPKHFCPTGEKLDENSKRLLREIFGDNLIDSYGTSETGAVLTRFSDSKPYVENADSFVVNIYGDDNKLANEGRIVITPLYCLDLPIINYEIGDRVKSKNVGSHNEITEIEGRVNDYFKHADGSVTSYFDMNKILGEFDDVVQIRFIQKSFSLIHIQCVKNKDKNISNAEVEKKLVDKIDNILKNDFKFEFEWLDSIPPDKNGKLRVIVSEV